MASVTSNDALYEYNLRGGDAKFTEARQGSRWEKLDETFRPRRRPPAAALKVSVAVRPNCLVGRSVGRTDEISQAQI